MIVGAVKAFLKVTAPIGAALLFGLYYFQSLLIYPSLVGDSRTNITIPSELGLDFEDLKLKTEDGETLQCWVLKQEADSPTYLNKTILILMPNAGNIGHALPMVNNLFKRLGYNVVIFLYRGYGLSTGTPLETGIKIDALRVMRLIAQDDAQLAKLLLVLFGQLLGGAVAIYIAATMPDAVSGMVIENTFTTIPQVVPHLFPFLAPFSGFVNQKWELVKLVPKLSVLLPVLLMSSRKDEIVPPAHMDTIYSLLRTHEKELVRFEHCTHNGAAGTFEYWDKFTQFMEQKVPPALRH